MTLPSTLALYFIALSLTKRVLLVLFLLFINYFSCTHFMCFNLPTPKTYFWFIQEFSDLLSVIMLHDDRILILGDFNIHFCWLISSLRTSDFVKLLESFNLSQFVKQPSHDKGHTLDLVLSMVSVWMRWNWFILPYLTMQRFWQVPLLSSDPNPPPTDSLLSPKLFFRSSLLSSFYLLKPNFKYQ